MVALLFLFFTLTTEDKGRIDALFAQQYKKMFGLAYRILGSKQEAEDAVGDAFLKIIDQFERIKEAPCHKTVPYCVVIVKNHCFTLLRKRKRAVSLEQAQSVADGGFMVEEEYFKGEDAARLKALIEKLSPIDRQLLRLHYMEEKNYREIAQLLNITEAAARKREQRALQRLRKLYTEEAGV